MSVLITLTDVEPAVRLNAALEQAGVETAVVSPLDDMRAAIRRAKPSVVVFTGGLLDQQNVQVCLLYTSRKSDLARLAASAASRARRCRAGWRGRARARS